MPEALEVSPEEERFLRSAFRRFALPYLLVVIGITGGAVAWSLASAPGADVPASDELQSLVSESAQLREAIAALRQEWTQETERAGERLSEIEGGVAKLRSASKGESAAELGSRLDHAHQRINALEGRLREMESSRAAAATPSPPPAAPAPASSAVDWPAPASTLP